jgi:carbon-monoxide dehydrogenase iron sulfur subunit
MQNMPFNAYFAYTCKLCDEPLCVKFCGYKALVKDESGFLKLDEDKCSGCGLCIYACKFGAIGMHPEKKIPLFCDLCENDPKCLELCPEEALKFCGLDDLEKEVKNTKLKIILREHYSA